jgi:hypothetical protein
MITRTREHTVKDRSADQSMRNSLKGASAHPSAASQKSATRRGTAPVAWMDGWTDRTAIPGKAGIANKWTALRSESDPVAKVEAPGEEKAEAPAKGKAKKS